MTQPVAERTWTILELLRWTTDHFAKQGIDSARLDAECLLAHALGVDRLRLYVEFDKPLAPGERSGFRELVRRRADQRVPVAQLVGRKEFWSLPLVVTPDVLTPRPETEGIIEAATHFCTGPRVIVDVGTGSGCLAIVLAREFPAARVAAVDVSPAALAVASRNAARHGMDRRIEFVQGTFATSAPRDVDLIVSNPPYIPETDRDSLPVEVRDHEPPLALFGGPDGLDVIRDLVWRAPAHLSDGGLLILECGAGQDAAIREMIATTPDLELMDFRPDLAGIPRIAVARRTFLYE
jgi:release factor glutamine methyltransferase